MGKAAGERVVDKTSGDTSHLTCSTPCAAVFILPLNWRNPPICRAQLGEMHTPVPSAVAMHKSLLPSHHVREKLSALLCSALLPGGPRPARRSRQGGLNRCSIFFFFSAGEVCFRREGGKGRFAEVGLSLFSSSPQTPQQSLALSSMKVGQSLTTFQAVCVFGFWVIVISYLFLEKI